MTNASQLRRLSTGVMERGRFNVGTRTFIVRTSGTDAPDSFQVHDDADRRDLVLVISGLNSDAVKATWNRDWRAVSKAWRERFEADAFAVFHNSERPKARTVRVCDG